VLIAVGLVGTAEAQGDAKAKLQALKPKDFPTQPIEFVVVYWPVAVDVTARLLAKYVEVHRPAGGRREPCRRGGVDRPHLAGHPGEE
jgi:hypothetical protein